MGNSLLLLLKTSLSPSYPQHPHSQLSWTINQPELMSSCKSVSQLPQSSWLHITYTVAYMLMFLTATDKNKSSKWVLSFMEKPVSCNLSDSCGSFHAIARGSTPCYHHACFTNEQIKCTGRLMLIHGHTPTGQHLKPDSPALEPTLLNTAIWYNLKVTPFTTKRILRNGSFQQNALCKDMVKSR